MILKTLDDLKRMDGDARTDIFWLHSKHSKHFYLALLKQKVNLLHTAKL